MIGNPLVPKTIVRPPVGTAEPDTDPNDTVLRDARLVPRRHVGRWGIGTVLVLIFAFTMQSAVRNSRFQWPVIWEYLRAPDVVQGLWLTVWLTLAVMATGYTLGIVIAAMRFSPNPVLRTAAFGYVWLFRSIPPLVLILLTYETASLYPRFSIGIPFGPEFFGTDTKHLFGVLFSAYVALTLDVAAFSAEIVRGGLVSVDRGQIEAAQSLGLPGRRIFLRIVLPQAMPAIVPNTGSLLIGTLKGTSLISVIAASDLLYSVELIYGQNYRVIPLLLVATIWYLVLVTVLSVGQYYVERYYGRGNRRDETRSVVRLMRQNAPLYRRAPRANTDGTRS